jgi:BlaI family transcriptional regulator, penicillinase repressor
MAAAQPDHRRPMGSLENRVLTCLWEADGPLTPREVLDVLDLDLAYSTVLTILTRLWKKGLTERERRGRVFLYRPRLDEADYVATAMRRELDRARDQAAVLSRFVGTLPKKDLRLLRELLDPGL